MPKRLRRSSLKCFIVLQNSDGEWLGRRYCISHCLTLCTLSPRVAPSVISRFSRYHGAGVEVEAGPQVDRWGFVVVVQKGFWKAVLDNWLSAFLSSRPSGAASLSNPWQPSRGYENPLKMLVVITATPPLKEHTKSIIQEKRGWNPPDIDCTFAWSSRHGGAINIHN